MKHYLFVTWEGGGTIPPELGLARRLVASGHRVTVLGDDCTREEVEQAGARFVGYRHAPNRPSKDKEHDTVQDWTFANPLAALKSAVIHKMCGPALETARDVIELHDRDPADVIVACGFLFGALIAGERAGLPTCALMPNIDFRPQPGRPPVGPGLSPMRGPLGRLRDALVGAVGRRAFLAGKPGLDRARRELGLPTLDHPFDEYARVRRVLLLTSRHFEYVPEPLQGAVFAGPVLDDPGWAAQWESPWARDDGRPLLLVTLGSTFQNQRDQYARILDALRGKNVRALVTLGNVFRASDFDPPANVALVDSAPHGPVLREVAAVLTHCGHGSVMKALAAGVPIVGMPLGRDQFENAARVAWHGVGVRLKATANAKAIGKAIDTVLGDPRYGAAARGMAQRIREEIAGDIAMRELEGLALLAPRAAA